ncbi:MAG TPA: CbiX/SirB N-terminal domain-containing protein [Candidatus Sulfopaludibacter sp.]|nr:CbiX/SirB N-terminal domain-containing protein [Candidatus Sulfopaludibacter sp.]
MTTGIVVFGHGSRVEAANESVRQAARELARLGQLAYVEPAFLELGEPDLEGAVVRLMGQGVRHIRVIPYFLTLGTHLERDLPRIIHDISSKFSDLEIEATAPLEGHPGLIAALLDRANT